MRNLLSEVPFAAGAHTVYWDGADESGGFHEEADGVWRSQGALVDPGEYHVRGLFHHGTDLRYESSVYTEGGHRGGPTTAPAAGWQITRRRATCCFCQGTSRR